MNIAGELASVIDEMSTPENFGTVAIVNGVTVPAIISDAVHSAEYAAQGLILEGLDTIVLVPKKYITTRPQTTTTLLVDGARRRILRVEEDEAAWVFVCGSATT
jgi:hypothetical protein